MPLSKFTSFMPKHNADIEGITLCVFYVICRIHLCIFERKVVCAELIISNPYFIIYVKKIYIPIYVV